MVVYFVEWDDAALIFCDVFQSVSQEAMIWEEYFLVNIGLARFSKVMFVCLFIHLFNFNHH